MGRPAWFENAAGEVTLHYSGLCAFDATGAALDAWMEPREGGLALCVVVADAAYPVTVDPIAQSAYIKASNTDAHDSFGVDVAISGDTVVVGAFREDCRYSGVNVGAAGEADDSAADAGAVYVFVRSGAGWIQQAYLEPSNDVPDRVERARDRMRGPVRGGIPPLQSPHCCKMGGCRAV